MIEVKEGNFALNEDLIAIARPLENGGTDIRYQTYYIREGSWVFETLKVDENVEEIAEKANLSKATQEDGRYLYFNPTSLISAESTENGTKLTFPVETEVNPGAVGHQSVTVSESPEDLELGVV